MPTETQKTEKKHLHYRFTIKVETDEVVKDKNIYVRMSESGKPRDICSEGHNSGPSTIFGLFRRGDRPKYAADWMIAQRAQRGIRVEVKAKMEGRVIAGRTFDLVAKSDGKPITKLLNPLKLKSDKKKHLVHVVYSFISEGSCQCRGTKSVATLVFDKQEGGGAAGVASNS